jgi:hypothetical protein
LQNLQVLLLVQVEQWGTVLQLTQTLVVLL